MAMKTETSFWETFLAPASASFGQLGTSALGTLESGKRSRESGGGRSRIGGTKKG